MIYNVNHLNESMTFITEVKLMYTFVYFLAQFSTWLVVFELHDTILKMAPVLLFSCICPC